ncbi:hybrid sensor histidine kinase/response regulator transcription factor [Pedobacter nyackensis]|uniref:histidine kinase n=1 Tax=Pedobacter nyackensis TaxID=475255 RepID=A0A1W2EU86_9SPHI|nr:hybrid sensor histidine kinase/response regulator transcription factor [Pedobacter nyackensis]SMD13221.1 Signal transduction histidine kinase [Pedobacter nyackensis]
MLFRKFIIFVALLFISIRINAQKATVYEDIKFINISLNQGLSQSSVLSILQDRKGYMWLGTRDGLNKYDGVRFVKYRYNSRDTNSLSNNVVRTSCEDEYGNLWIGTASGLNRYNAQVDNFVRYKLAQKGNQKQNDILSLSPDRKGNLWVGTAQGLFKLDIKKGTKVLYQHKEKEQGSLSADIIQALLKTPDGNIWVSTNKGVDQYRPVSNSFVHYRLPEVAGTNTNFIASLYLDKQQNLLLGYKGGLAILNKKNNAFEHYKIGTNFITDPVRSIKEDGRHNLWIGTYNGLYIFNITDKSITRYQHDENNNSSLSQNSVYSICRDQMGDMWVGTYFGGINYYSSSYNRFKHVTAGNNNRTLNYKVVSSIIEDDAHNLWIGTEGGGINFYNKKTGIFTYYTHSEKDPNSISANNVKTMLMDKTGGLWIGLHDGGLNYLNTSVRPYRFKKINSGIEGNLSSNRVVSLFQDETGYIWIGTSGGGLNRLNPVTGKIIRIVQNEKILGDIVYLIAASSKSGQVLIGSNAGLVEMDINTLQSRQIVFNEANKNNAPPPVLSIYNKSGNELWVGTEGDGLYSYNLLTKKSKHYGISEGLPNDVIYGILPDAKNNLWLSTNNGLSQLQVSSGRIKNFDESDGLPSKEFNYGASMLNKVGLLYFGGTNGFCFFNPDQITTNTYVPPVYITEIKVNNQLINAWDGEKEIELAHDHNMLNFTFVALNYSQSQKNQYAVQLEGFDKDWNDLGNTNSLTYTNLDAGTYTFRVKASNNDGVWNKNGTSIKIHIATAPWKTWWAYSIYAIIICSILFLMRRQTLQRLKVRNELAAERGEKEKMKYLNQLFTNISHDFRTPLTLIMSPLKQMIQLEKGDEYVQKQHHVMYKNAMALMMLINQLLDLKKSESTTTTLQVSQQNIVPYLEEIKSYFDEYAREREIHYYFESTDPVIMVWFDGLQFQKVIYNLLSNAFKFTPNGGTITLRVTTNDSDNVNIEVLDTGSGIPDAHIKMIFDEFYQVKQGHGTGIGLALVKNIVNMHHGNVEVQSVEHHGSAFKVSLPIKKLRPSGYNMYGSEIVSPVNLPDMPWQYDLPQLPEIPFTYDEKRASILVVDDNDDLRRFISGLFSVAYNVYNAENGAEAIKIASQKSIDVVISDVMMPEMDGMEFCRRMKSNILTSHIPILLITAKATFESEKSGYELGADAYITKPFDPDVLSIRIHHLLESRKKLVEKYHREYIMQPAGNAFVETASPDEQFLKDFTTIVDEYLMEPDFTIDVLVKKIGMSRSVLYRKLKALTGQSIAELVKTIKLKKAAQLLMTTNMSVSEIAFALNFNDQKHFRQSFKTLFNQLPSAYRKQMDDET